jgi:CheY-like chemotaxis protein
MDGYGKRILVIDDDAGCRAVLEAQLEKEGYAVRTAGDGLEGLHEMHTRRFDAVIADCRMPGLTGIEFAELCRISWPDTPIILLSGDPNYFTQYAEESGAVACIHKPYEATLLLSVLRLATQHVSSDQGRSLPAQMKH